MKKLEELGISPTPWSYDGGVLHDGDYSEIVSGCEDGFGGACVDMQDSDGRLISAAPELYEALREAVIEMCHAYCEDDVYRGCPKKDGECFVQKWRKVLAKADGEEVSK